MSASIPISEIIQNIYNFSEFCRENRPVSVFCPFRNTPHTEIEYMTDPPHTEIEYMTDK